ncbi:MAG: glycosyltransferase family 4 protein, partial [Chlamydiota bacterium]
MNHNAPPTAAIKVTIVSRHIKGLGGLEKWTRRISNGFSRKGALVTVLTSDTPEKNNSKPFIDTRTLPLTKRLNFQKIDQFNRLVRQWNRRHQADIIFGMDGTSHQTHLRAGNGVHAAYLKQRHTLEDYPRYKSLLNPLNRTILNIEKKAFENPELRVLFTNSYMVKNEILEHYRVSPDKIEVIHNGAPWKETERLFSRWVENKQQGWMKYRLDPTLYHFLFIGNGYERKGLGPLLKALATLSNKGFHLSIVGKDRKIETFIKLAKSLGLEKRSRFFGPVSDVYPLFQLADCLVIPSRYDPFANVTVEALAMGLFVVSSKNNGGHEILQDETGTIIENLASIDSLRASLEYAMSHPKTSAGSQAIRDSVKHLDHSDQL